MFLVDICYVHLGNCYRNLFLEEKKNLLVSLLIKNDCQHYVFFSCDISIIMWDRKIIYYRKTVLKCYYIYPYNFIKFLPKTQLMFMTWINFLFEMLVGTYLTFGLNYIHILIVYLVNELVLDAKQNLFCINIYYLFFHTCIV